MVSLTPEEERLLADLQIRQAAIADAEEAERQARREAEQTRIAKSIVSAKRARAHLRFDCRASTSSGEKFFDGSEDIGVMLDVLRGALACIEALERRIRDLEDRPY